MLALIVPFAATPSIERCETLCGVAVPTTIVSCPVLVSFVMVSGLLVAAAGSPETVNVMASEKLPVRVTVTVTGALAPCWSVSVAGAEMVKPEPLSTPLSLLLPVPDPSCDGCASMGMLPSCFATSPSDREASSVGRAVSLPASESPPDSPPSDAHAGMTSSTTKARRRMPNRIGSPRAEPMG